MEKKKGIAKARPIRYSILRLFSFTWGEGKKCENKCRFYYSLRLREIHGMEIAGERKRKKKKRLVEIST